MRESASLGYEENVAEAERLARLFSALYELPMPTIAVVQGAAFGGGVGLVACCDWAIAVEGARFCLSEVKVGLVAAVILPYLHHKMVPGELRRLVMTASVFDAEHALRAGLVQRVVSPAELDAMLREECAAVLAGEPQIQRTFKANHRKLLDIDDKLWQAQRTTGVETIAKARVSKTGQAGIRAFLEKRTPEWVLPLPEEWKLP
jgi:methylglutaconyl-CoA hydratase